jgi:hypothetical protein
MASVLTSIFRQVLALLIPHAYIRAHLLVLLQVVVYPKHLLVE